MGDMNVIEFDEMEVNTDLAKEYFKKNNYQFPNDHGLSNRELKKDKDKCNNTIFYNTYEADKDDTFNRAHRDILVHEEKLIKLAAEIEKNAETFCQIEYLIRNIPVNEVREYDIKLLVQYLLCGAADREGYGILKMCESTPLAFLGLASQAAFVYEKVQIVSTANTAAVCHLFTDLCHIVGLGNVVTYSVQSAQPNAVLPIGCIGVVTECSDIDSAVDTFLHTTTRYPWKLSRVLVQESVYESFKKSVAWKCNLKTGVAGALCPNPDNCCTGTFDYDSKTFLFDYAGNVENATGVLVEAYRTTKELISILETHGARYLSLWASDISQANEIAYNVSSLIVWINSYGVFDGPPQASLAIYTELLLDKIQSAVSYSDAATNDLLRKQELWARMPFEERRKIVQTITYDFCKEVNDENKTFFEDLLNGLRKVKSGEFARVDKGLMCVGKPVPFKVVTFDRWFHNRLYKNVFVKLLTCGSAVTVTGHEQSDLSEYFERLATKVPIVIDSSKSDPFYNTDPLTRFQVVWTNYGTIFAN